MRKEQLVEFGRRITARLEEQKKSLADFAKGIDKSYEMARRYARGWAMPSDPKDMERIAKYLNISVGHLLADELDSKSLPPLVNASDIEQPITGATRMIVEDEAMLLVVENIRLFGVGDQVILYPRKALPGDIVALRVRNSTTLRKLIETKDGAHYLPTKEGYAPHSAGTVLGVVGEVHGRTARFQ